MIIIACYKYEGKRISKCDFNEVDIISFKDIKKYIGREDCLIVDLREDMEYRRAHIKTAVNIEYNSRGITIPEKHRKSLIIFYCDSGNRALIMAKVMSNAGYRTIAVADRFTH